MGDTSCDTDGAKRPSKENAWEQLLLTPVFSEAGSYFSRPTNSVEVLKKNSCM